MKPAVFLVLGCAALLQVATAQSPAPFPAPLFDAHNCYPYEGKYTDRIDRALATGFPVAIEQDIGFFGGEAVVTHTDKTTGTEPTLKQHFFERVRPIIEKALKDNRRDQWPLIVLHFDFKDLKPETLRAVWKVLEQYEPWLATGTKSADPTSLQPIAMKPILVLTEDADEQEAIFDREVPVGGKLRLFGSAHTKGLTQRATNYRRWLNYSWREVEPEGQPKATEWTPAKAAKLKSIVENAHKLGYWMRFYTVDGFTEAENQGWFQTYNFPSRAAAEIRWNAEIQAGVDLIASDQYEILSALMRQGAKPK